MSSIPHFSVVHNTIFILPVTLKLIPGLDTTPSRQIQLNMTISPSSPSDAIRNHFIICNCVVQYGFSVHGRNHYEVRTNIKHLTVELWKEYRKYSDIFRLQVHAQTRPRL